MIKTYEEITKKFEDIYWPDGEHVIDQGKWGAAEKEFEEFLAKSSWTRDAWLDEQCKRFKL